jgi:class 3 adenylate cyclase
MDRPQTRYVTVGNGQVAYQVIGDGPSDLLCCYGLGGHVDLWWLDPRSSRVLGGMASFSRLIIFDRRGTGASDARPLSPLSAWEELTEDMAAVLEAAGSKRTALMATLEVGPIAVLYAAMHPEQVSALILRNTTARWLYADDYPIGTEPAAVDAIISTVGTTWGTEELVRLAYPSLAADTEWLRWTAMLNRASATPRGTVAQLESFNRVDVRHALPLIKAPTLVLQACENPLLPPSHGRYLAEHIEGATLIEVPGADIGPLGDDRSVADIAEFLTGERPPVEVDRILTTVLFTDIAASTERAVVLGDHRWRELLDQHDRTVRDHFRRFRGREINTTGDGFVASFDGPARAIRCSQAIAEATTKLGIELRIGLHTGECEVRGDDLGGLAVHIAARVAATAAPGEVLVSSTVKDLVAGSGIEFSDSGEHELKGVPGTWTLFSVSG